MEEPDFVKKAKLKPKGNRYEDFEPGRVFHHHWGRTISQAENAIFSMLTLHFNPQYTNVEFAKAMGHADTPVNPLLVFNTIFGMSVEDLSEGGGPFLSVEELVYHKPVYPGDTIFARSTVVDRRSSNSNPKMGIAKWHTQGFNQRGELVCEFKRSNLINKRNP
jgi:itaconyl-CoA hydratase